MVCNYRNLLFLFDYINFMCNIVGIIISDFCHSHSCSLCDSDREEVVLDTCQVLSVCGNATVVVNKDDCEGTCGLEFESTAALSSCFVVSLCRSINMTVVFLVVILFIRIC